MVAIVQEGLERAHVRLPLLDSGSDFLRLVVLALPLPAEAREFQQGLSSEIALEHGYGGRHYEIIDGVEAENH